MSTKCDSDGDGSVVQVATDFEAVVVPCPLGTPPSTMRVQLCEGDGSVAQGPHVVTASSTHEVGPPQAMEVAPGYKHLEVVPVEDCTVGSDEEILGDDRLDLNFSDDDCDSPQGTEILPAPILSPPVNTSKTVHSLQQSEKPPASNTGRQVPAPPLVQVTLSLAPLLANGVTFSFPIELLLPAPSFTTIHLITYLNRVLFPMMIS